MVQDKSIRTNASGTNARGHRFHGHGSESTFAASLKTRVGCCQGMRQRQQCRQGRSFDLHCRMGYGRRRQIEWPREPLRCEGKSSVRWRTWWPMVLHRCQGRTSHRGSWWRHRFRPRLICDRRWRAGQGRRRGDGRHGRNGCRPGSSSVPCPDGGGRDEGRRRKGGDRSGGERMEHRIPEQTVKSYNWRRVSSLVTWVKSQRRRSVRRRLLCFFANNPL
jgi:hypothetical protein